MPSVPIKKRRQIPPIIGGPCLLDEKGLRARLNAGRRKTREIVSSGVIPKIKLGPRCDRYDSETVDEVIRQIAEGEIDLVAILREQKNRKLQKISERA